MNSNLKKLIDILINGFISFDENVLMFLEGESSFVPVLPKLEQSLILRNSSKCGNQIIYVSKMIFLQIGQLNHLILSEYMTCAKWPLFMKNREESGNRKLDVQV